MPLGVDRVAAAVGRQRISEREEERERERKRREREKQREKRARLPRGGRYAFISSTSSNSLTVGWLVGQPAVCSNEKVSSGEGGGRR